MAATVQATRAPRFAAAAARGILYDIDVHSFRLDGAPRSSCHLPPSRNSAARVRGRSFVARVRYESHSCPAVYRSSTRGARPAAGLQLQLIRMVLVLVLVLCQTTHSSRCCGERGYEGACKRTL